MRKRKVSNENLIDSESIEINSRLSDSQREVRTSQIKKETMREVAKRQRKYMSKTPRREKQKKRKNFQMWLQILKSENND